VATIKALSVAAGAAFIVCGTVKVAAAATFSDAPLFNDVASYSTTISANNFIAAKWSFCR
jgi:hypothetical protein